MKNRSILLGLLLVCLNAWAEPSLEERTRLGLIDFSNDARQLFSRAGHFLPGTHPVFYQANRKENGPEELVVEGSVSLVGIGPERGKGKATLVGFKRLDDTDCRYVFLTVAHFFTGAPPTEKPAEEFEITMSELRLATRAVTEPIKKYSVWFHPRARLNSYDATIYNNDLTLFRFEAACSKTAAVPFEILALPNPTGHVFLNRIQWTEPLGYQQKTAELTRLATLSATSSAYNEQKSKYRLSWQGHGVAPGDSGSAIFKSVDGKYKMVGMLYGKLSSDDAKPRMPLPGLATGGKEVMEDIQRALDRALSDDEWGIQTAAGQKLSLSERLFFPPE